jgi:hypothetical protein
MELWILLQVALEAVLVLLMIVFLFKLRRLRGPNPLDFDELHGAVERFLSESDRLSRNFSKNLEQKKELSLSLLLKLERKINEMNSLLRSAEKSQPVIETKEVANDVDQVDPATPESRTLVLKLAREGFSPEEIARQARLNRGEVELILDLERQFRL